MISKLIFAIILLLASPAWATIAVVQSVGAQATNLSSVTTPSITSTTGDLFICDAGYIALGASFDSITDNKGNAYAVAVPEFSSSGDSDRRAQQRYAANGTGGASHTFTFTATGNMFPALACKEVSDAQTSNVLDRTSSFGDNSTALTTGLTSGSTAGTTQSDELLAGGGMLGQGTADTTFTAQSGFTANQNLSHVSGSFNGMISASKVVSATGSYAFTYDISVVSGAPSLGWIATYKSASGAPTVTRNPFIIIQ
jgi:hypothetical protein